MSGDGIQLTTTVTDKASFALQLLASRVKDLDPALDEIGASNVTETQVRFEQEKDPEGKRWVGHSALTIARRGEGAPILRQDVHLYDSLTHKVQSKKGVSVGVSVKYGRIHQLGGKAGRGRRVTIPARPFLGISKAGRQEALDIMRDHITGDA